jgi:integrase
VARFTSFLAPLIDGFVRHREASGRWNESSYGPNLLLFDRDVLRRFPDGTALTQEMVDGWCARRPTESNSSCRSRAYVVAGLVKHLRARGLTDVAPPALPPARRGAYTPHAFTDDELDRFFAACDSVGPPAPRTLEQWSRRITVPVFFRLLYSTGLRTTEARLLATEDVDLVEGVLSVRRSKGGAQHHVPVCDSMLELLKQYDAAVRVRLPGRAYFFPARNDSFHTRVWVQNNFKAAWEQASGAPATAYELRHHYATENVNRWVGQGFDFHAKLVYLSKTMGHTVLESTRRYYSLVPALADLLRQRTGPGFDAIIPEARHG